MRLVRELGEVRAEVAGLKTEVAGVCKRLDDIVITQLRDHGKRIAALEASENRRSGALVVLGALCGFSGALLARLLR